MLNVVQSIWFVEQFFFIFIITHNTTTETQRKHHKTTAKTTKSTTAQPKIQKSTQTPVNTTFTTVIRIPSVLRAINLNRDRKIHKSKTATVQQQYESNTKEAQEQYNDNTTTKKSIDPSINPG